MFGYARRIQEALHEQYEVAQNFVGYVSFELSVFCSNMIDETLPQVYEGLARIPEVGRNVYHALFDKNEKKREINRVIRPALATNFFYYAVPVGMSLGLRYAIKQIPMLRDPRIESGIDSITQASMVYLAVRRLVDNTLYTANLMRSHSDEVIRKNIYSSFDKMLPSLTKSLSKIIVKKQIKEQSFRQFNEEFLKVMKKTLVRNFRDPNLFRNKNLPQRLKTELLKIFAVMLIRPESEISPTYNAEAMADALTNVLLSRFLVDFDVSTQAADEKLLLAFKRLGKEKYVKRILNIVNYHSAQKEFFLLPGDKCEHSSSQLFDSLLRNPVDYLSSMLFISGVSYFCPLGGSLAFVLNAQFYGRSLLELRYGNYCLDDRIIKLSGKKAHAFGLGLPFALVISSVDSWFLRDALLNMMLHVWTVAELGDKKPLAKSLPGRNFFYIPQVFSKIVLRLGTKIVPPIAKALRDPESQKRFADNMVEAVNSPMLHKTVAFLLDNPFNVPEEPSAVDVLLKLDSAKLFLKFYGDDISSGISLLNKIRFFRPWIASPLLSLLAPGMVSSSFSLGLHLLKEDGLNQLFTKLHIGIEKEKQIPVTELHHECKVNYSVAEDKGDKRESKRDTSESKLSESQTMALNETNFEMQMAEILHEPVPKVAKTIEGQFSEIKATSHSAHSWFSPDEAQMRVAENEVMLNLQERAITQAKKQKRQRAEKDMDNGFVVVPMPEAQESPRNHYSFFSRGKDIFHDGLRAAKSLMPGASLIGKQ